MKKAEKLLNTFCESGITQEAIDTLTQMLTSGDDNTWDILQVMYWMAHLPANATSQALCAQPFNMNLKMVQVLGQINRKIGLPLKIEPAGAAQLTLSDWLTIVKTLSDAAYNKYFYQTPKSKRLNSIARLRTTAASSLDTLRLLPFLKTALNKATPVKPVSTLMHVIRESSVILSGTALAALSQDGVGQLISIGSTVIPPGVVALLTLFGTSTYAVLWYSLGRFAVNHFINARNEKSVLDKDVPALKELIVQSFSHVPSSWESVKTSNDLGSVLFRWAFVQSCLCQAGIEPSSTQNIAIQNLSKLHIQHLTPATAIEHFRNVNAWAIIDTSPFHASQLQSSDSVPVDALIYLLNGAREEKPEIKEEHAIVQPAYLIENDTTVE